MSLPRQTTGSMLGIASGSNIVEVKSKFDAEFRRFHFARDPMPNADEFQFLLKEQHRLTPDIPFTITYTDSHGDLLPINNDDNFRHAVEQARPLLRILLQRKGESWEEKYGYGLAGKSKRSYLSSLITGEPEKIRHDKVISMPEDFRAVSSIIDVDAVPETQRRVRLCKHGTRDKPLGFYIRDGQSMRVTTQGVERCPGIFVSRLVPGGLAEMTGLIAVNDEVLEVNGIEVANKTLDQVTDMMIANSGNLILTIKPQNQTCTLRRQQQHDRPSSGGGMRGTSYRSSQASAGSGGNRSAGSMGGPPSYHSDDDDDEIRVHQPVPVQMHVQPR